MGCHLDIQEKVIQELDEIFGDSDRPVTFQDTLEMKYLERCLMETLRLFPPVPIIARKINTDLKLGTSNSGCLILFGISRESFSEKPRYSSDLKSIAKTFGGIVK